MIFIKSCILTHIKHKKDENLKKNVEGKTLLCALCSIGSHANTSPSEHLYMKLQYRRGYNHKPLKIDYMKHKG